MSQAITVPATFLSDFKYYCKNVGLDVEEQNELRHAIRADYETVGKWIVEMANTYRFIYDTWGMMPTADLCRGFLCSKGWYPEDDTIYMRWGIMLLARKCAEVAGRL